MPDIVFQSTGLGMVLAIMAWGWTTIRREQKGLKEDNQVCNWRLNMVVEASRAAGVPIPNEIWGPPPWQRDTPKRRGRHGR